MTTLLTFFARLFGYDTDVVRVQPTRSKQKIVTFGLLMLIPVMFYMLIGFLFPYTFMGMGFLASMGVALGLGFIVLLIDRSFMSTPTKSKYSFLAGLGAFAASLPRLGLAIGMSILAAMLLDLAIFQGDLDAYRRGLAADEKEEKIEKYLRDHEGDLLPIIAEVQEAQSRFLALQQDYKAEMSGEGGTGRYGVGPVAQSLAIQMAEAKADHEDLRKEFAEREAELVAAAKLYAEEKTIVDKTQILEQISALSGFLEKESEAKFFYYLLFGVVLIIESFFLLYKLLSKETAFERYLAAEEQLKIAQIEARQAQLERVLTYRKQHGDFYKDDESREGQIMKVI